MPASRSAGSPRPISIRPRRPPGRAAPGWRHSAPREPKPATAMIRFVIAPDGEVVADLRRRLPGRGVWVTAKSDLVATAEKKHLFQRGFGEPVKVAPGLAGRVAGQLATAAESALSLARKAGLAIAG